MKLGDRFFTQLFIVGKLNEMDNEIPPHWDEEDILSCILTLDSPINGDYDILKNNRFGAKIFLVPYKYYHIQIGWYNKINYGVCSWNYNRITLNFNLNKNSSNSLNCKKWNITRNINRKAFLSSSHITNN